MIDDDNEKILEARNVYNAALKEFNLVTHPIQKRHSELLNIFKDKKNKEIFDEQTCNCCKPKYYSYASFTKDGILLSTDSDHPYDRQDEEFSWEDVEKSLILY